MVVDMTSRSVLHKTLLLLGVLFTALAVQAQNCALCYTQAAGGGSRFIQGLRSGILILIFPPMMICIGFTVSAYKKRNRFHQEAESHDKSDLGW